MKLLIILLSLALLPAAFATDKAKAISSLGAVGADAVFSKYMALTELGDLLAAKSYDKGRVSELADTFAKLAKAANESLSELLKSGQLEKGDANSVREMMGINELLLKTADAVKAYAQDPTKQKLDAYNQVRLKAWNAISKLLGIKDERPAAKSEAQKKAETPPPKAATPAPKPATPVPKPATPAPKPATPAPKPSTPVPAPQP